MVKAETLDLNRHLALSAADGGMSRLAYKADWRGGRIVQCDPWFPSSQTCCMCSALHPEMRNLSVRTLSCDCHGPRPRCRGNLFWYPEERENRIGNGPTRVETGDQGLALRCPSVKREYLLMESNNSEEES